MRPTLEVADVFRAHGPPYRRAQAGHLSLGQLKAMSAIEACRTAELGGHVERCEDCSHLEVAYNSCRNRHCPRCQGAAAKRWLEARQTELLPVAYYHVVFTVPAEVADIAFHNKAVVYDILFKAASETLLTIGKDPKHLGGRLGVTAVLHTWGSALTHHPHLHCIVPGGGLSPDGRSWIACRPRFFLPVRVLSRLFRRLFLDRLAAAHAEGRLDFYGDLAGLADRAAFTARLAPLRRREWVVYAKRPFAGPEAVLAYLARYTHRVAISSSRLVNLDHRGVAFRYKDYRRDGPERQKRMTLSADEFIRRFLIHVLPPGLPPHSPLRPVRQHRPRRQPGEGPRPARAAVRPADFPGRQRQRRHLGSFPLSLLWRPDASHRGVQARRPAPPRTDLHRARDR